MLLGVAALTLSFTLAGCTGDDARESAPSRTEQPTPRVTVEVAETEYALDVAPRDGLIPADYRIVVHNGGETDHALAVKGPGVDEQTPVLGTGDPDAEIVARLRPGTYELWCPVGDHRSRGMRTSLLIEAL